MLRRLKVRAAREGKLKIQAGRYYRNYWLRYVANVHLGRVLIQDFTGETSLSRAHFMRWAKEEYTEAEAKERFPKEFKEIERANR
jgi:hypothetical protein